MFSNSLRHKTAILLLTASLAMPWAASAAPIPLEALSRAWSLLASLWSGQKNDTGCHIDPSGSCVKPAADTGCGIDPSGSCVKPAAVVPADTGCGIDPDGRCVKPAAETGCGIDPNGCRQ